MANHRSIRVVPTVDSEGDFRVVAAREQARRLLGFYRDLAPGRSLADDLMAERWDEGRREEYGQPMRARPAVGAPRPLPAAPGSTDDAHYCTPIGRCVALRTL